MREGIRDFDLNNRLDALTMSRIHQNIPTKIEMSADSPLRANSTMMEVDGEASNVLIT